jgi:ferric-dicitrate binding protein FerR (iron transport regulator)
MNKINLQIDWTLLRKATVGKLDSKEEDLFENWLSYNKENRDFFEKAKLHYSERDVDFPEFESAYQNFLQHITKRKKRIRFIRVRAAASIAILIMSGYFLYHSFYANYHELSELSEIKTIQAVKGNIELILSDGRQLMLDNKKTAFISELSGQIKKTGNTIDYRSYHKSEIEISKLNTLKTPKGKSLKIILSDSSIVWLNAESSISYLVPFEKSERRVSITGEAYFEVVKNSVRPFIVETNGAEIKVLGTRFDVNSYNVQKGIYTTLIEGAVDVKDLSAGNRVLLKPNEQAIISPLKEIVVENVNTSLIIDWKDGRFIFEKEKLGSIFEELSRWYDINFQFETNKLKEYEFSGYLERYQDLNILLELFEDTRAVKFSMKDNVLNIGEYKK